jgi:hypothetical protein
MKKLVGILTLLAFVALVPFASADVGLNKRNIWTAPQTFKYGIDVDGHITLNGSQIGTAFSKVWYVCSVNGQDTMGNHYGKYYDKPFATLEYAIAQCRAGYGDVIIALPSHNEGITSAAEIDFDIAGIFVIGIGTGDDKPTIDFDHADGSVAIGADNVTVQNLRFRTSADAVTVGLDIEDGADYAQVIGCEFGWAETATDEFAISLRTNDASNFAVIDGCMFQAGAQAAVTAIEFAKDTDHTTVRNCWITGTYSTAPIMGITTASTNLLIEYNRLFTAGTADTFNLVAASTGIVAYNLIAMNSVSAATALDIGNCLNFENYLIADDDVGGTKAAVVSTTFASVAATADD